ncbi:FAD dependent oxidoreductase [Xylariaceae sp. FL0804]|nr:FAD dependent oxidoreductase [Xylariaceae sp. FL0804]
MLTRAVVRQCLARTGGKKGGARPFSSTPAASADFTHVVIGGGVVGLAIARELAASRPSSETTLLLERHGAVGTETSSRNSEVIHGGLYYGADSLKTRLCVAGKEKLYAFCEAHNVGYRRTGKWIVAQTDAEREALEGVHAFCSRGGPGGVPTRWVGAGEAAEAEPAVRATAGVLDSPTTGIVDSHGLMTALHGLFEDAGGVTALNSHVEAIEPLGGSGAGGGGSSSLPGSGGWRLAVTDAASGERSSITAETLINSAGLGAVEINNMIVPPSEHRKLYYAKGNYFSYAHSQPKVSRLIYPVTLPGAGGLGTHLTLDLAGRLRFGPDVEWVEDPTDLRVNTDRFPAILAAIRSYLPGVDAAALAPDYAGIRPKLGRAGAVGSGAGFVDFHVRAEPGYAGWVNLLGIESPGLTSSLALADYVRDLLYGSASGTTAGNGI